METLQSLRKALMAQVASTVRACKRSFGETQHEARQAMREYLANRG